MSTFSTIFFGFYILLFLTPIVGFIVYRKIDKKYISKLFIVCAILLLVIFISRVFNLSLVGYYLDTIFLFITYLVTGVCAALVFHLKSQAGYKLLGVFANIPFIVIPLLSIPAVLGVAFVVGDLEPVLEKKTFKSSICRVTRFGNATTKHGGYKAHIYKQIAFIELDLGEVKMISTRKPDVTPEYACKHATIKYKS